MTQKLFALCGIAASILFTALFILFAALTPGYDHLSHAVSELGMSNSPYALLWNLLGFGLVGLLIVVFAWSLYLEFKSTRGGMLLSTLIGISGLGYVGLGIFPATIGFQPSTATTLHTMMVMTSYFAFIIAAFAFAVSQRNNPDWKRWALFSAAMGAIGLLSFAVPRSIPLGLSQQVGLGANFLWLLVMGFALYRKPIAKE